MGCDSASLATQVIAQRAIENIHTQVFFIAAMLCLILTVIPHGNRRGLGWQRKVFWTGVFSAATCAFIAGLPNLVTAFGVAAMIILLTAAHAYIDTQYVKIGGRVIAFRKEQDFTASSFGTGQDPYSSRVSAAKMWWLVVLGIAGGSVNVLGYVIDSDISWAGVVWLGLCLVLPFTFGFLDGIERQRVARGQYLQFAVITVISAGVFSVLYSVAYTVALRRSAASR